jgi:hypothetical protein
MARPKPRKRSSDEIKVEPGADKRLADILKKALNTPARHAKSQSGARKTKPRSK